MKFIYIALIAITLIVVSYLAYIKGKNDGKNNKSLSITTILSIVSVILGITFGIWFFTNNGNIFSKSNEQLIIPPELLQVSGNGKGKASNLITNIGPKIQTLVEEYGPGILTNISPLLESVSKIKK